MAANPSIQLGTDGNWAIKEDNLLAYKQDGTRFFNKEFNFSRSSLATFVDKDGLIKVSGVTSTELIINGDFATDSDWSKGAGWTISGGKANCNGTNSPLDQSSISSSKTYKVNFSSNEILSITSDGEYEAYGTADSSLFRLRSQGGFIGSVDNVSVVEVQTDVPRIDFKDNTTGHLLLEPQTTNRVIISENTPQSSSNVVLTKNYATSPDGNQNSLKVQKTGTSANDRIYPISNYNATLVSGDSYSISAFVKNIDVRNGGTTTMACRVSGGSLFRRGFEWDGSSLSLTSDYEAGSPTNVFVEDYGNDWWRIGFTFVADGTSGNFELDIDRDFGSDTTSIETWGWQLENATYVTSYIPTSGSIVTRNADACNNSGSLQDFNSEEGVLYAEISGVDDGENRRISISDGTNNNRVVIYFNTSNNLLVLVRVANSTSFSYTFGTDIKQFLKVGLKWKLNDFALWVNGVKVAGDTSGPTFANNILDGISFADGNGTSLPFYGKTKNIKVFKRALSDAELQKLTT